MTGKFNYVDHEQGRENRMPYNYKTDMERKIDMKKIKLCRIRIPNNFKEEFRQIQHKSSYRQ